MKYFVFSLEERYSTMRTDPGTSLGICREKNFGERVFQGPQRGKLGQWYCYGNWRPSRPSSMGRDFTDCQIINGLLECCKTGCCCSASQFFYFKYHVQIFIFSSSVSLFLDEYPLCTVNFRFKKSKKKKIRSVLQNPSCTVNIVKLK